MRFLTLFFCSTLVLSATSSSWGVGPASPEEEDVSQSRPVSTTFFELPPPDGKSDVDPEEITLFELSETDPVSVPSRPPSSEGLYGPKEEEPTDGDLSPVEGRYLSPIHQATSFGSLPTPSTTPIHRPNSSPSYSSPAPDEQGLALHRRIRRLIQNESDLMQENQALKEVNKKLLRQLAKQGELDQSLSALVPQRDGKIAEPENLVEKNKPEDPLDVYRRYWREFAAKHRSLAR